MKGLNQQLQNKFENLRKDMMIEAPKHQQRNQEYERLQENHHAVMQQFSSLQKENKRLELLLF